MRKIIPGFDFLLLGIKILVTPSQRCKTRNTVSNLGKDIRHEENSWRERVQEGRVIRQTILSLFVHVSFFYL